MPSVQPVASEADFAAATAALPPTTTQIIYFHAPWAAPCEHMSKVLDALAALYPPDDKQVAFLSVNAEELPEVSETYDVTAVPFTVVKWGDSVLESVAGADAARVREAIEKHAGKPGDGGAAVELNRGGAALPPQQSVTRPTDQPAPVNGAAPAQAAATEAPAKAAEDGEPESKEALFARLKELTTAAPCMLFMKGTPSAPQCGFSRQLVAILREHSVRYGFFNILADDDVRQGLKEYAEWPTFPQLWLNGELCGGLDIVREEVEADAGFFEPFSVKAKASAPVAS